MEQELKQKQIEEMAKVYDEATAYARNYLGSMNNAGKWYGNAIYNAGYRKIPEGSVVISKEQNENWLAWLESNIEKARKEAVEKFVTLLLREYSAFDDEQEIKIREMRGDIQDVASAFIGGTYES